MTASPSSPFALVLPGAVTRGAYEAGVIDVLVQQDLKIDRIVATSSGALNGLAFASGIRSGNKRGAVDSLIKAWVDRGQWQESLNLSPFAFMRGRGFSTHEKLLKMMRDLIKPCRSRVRHPVELRIILTPLNGVLGSIDGVPATTYEKVATFTGDDFDTPETLERMFHVVAAACSFPGLFEPVDVPGLGCCIDGGAVNNAPIKYALEESEVNRVIVPVAFPRVMAPGDWKKGLGFLNHLVEILINERLYRDLKEAHAVNKEALELEALCRKGVLTADQVIAVKKAIRLRKVEITQIRPREGLKSSPFAGFFYRSERMSLIDQGRQAATEALEKIPPENPDGIQTT